MKAKILNFFNSESIKNLKEITIEQLLFRIAEKDIANNSADAYYFIRLCRGMGVLTEIKPKLFNINHKLIEKELLGLENVK